MSVTRESLFRALLNNCCTCINCGNEQVAKMTYEQSSLEENITCSMCGVSWRSSLTTTVIDEIKGPDGNPIEGLDYSYLKFLGTSAIGKESFSDRFANSKRHLFVTLISARFLVEYFKNPTVEFSIHDKAKIIAMMDQYLPMIDFDGKTPAEVFQMMDSEIWSAEVTYK